MNRKDNLNWCETCQSKTTYIIKVQETPDGQLLDHYCSKCGNFLFFLSKFNEEKDDEYEN